MSPENLRISLQKIAANYLSKLETIPDHEFQRAPFNGGWSYSQVYSHIWDASLLSMQALENTYTGKGKIKPTAFLVKVILFYGAFPPAAKYKVPKELESRVTSISKDQSRDLIANFLLELNKAMPQISNADLYLKTLHPRLGYLNAHQWLRFIEIHLKHHFKQIKRIEKTF